MRSMRTTGVEKNMVFSLLEQVKFQERSSKISIVASWKTRFASEEQKPGPGSAPLKQTSLQRLNVHDMETQRQV